MSHSVEIKKTLDVQVDYVNCQDCGEALEFTLDSDCYGDLQITVERCTCGDVGAGE